ncbi:MAG: hypothetical protein ACI87E_001461 [Mariniblastus sp.]|jgi:hypothetical protein
MLSWFMNPWMLLGGLAVASPILIHLLNKRRFKIVEWAAMDFLFEADKKNRRRVELENFLLLLLRCLAMLLIALLFARPFLPSSLTSVLQQAQRIERVILIDDSFSQRVLNESEPTFDVTKSRAKELIGQFAESDKTEDWLTIMLTSDSERPFLANEPLTKNTLAQLIQTIDDLECSDKSADYTASLSEMKRYVSGQRESGGRVAYVFSDMRENDWVNAFDANSETAPNQLLTEISKDTIGCFLVDVGSPNDSNLAITSVRPENLLVAGKVTQFNVTVANYGTQTVSQVRVLLQVDEGQPDYETIPSIAPGQTADVAFLYVFPTKDAAEINLDEEEQYKSRFTNYRVTAEIDRQSLGDEGLALDQLKEDSVAYYASRAKDRISILLVDGDPSAKSERSETHYLRRLEMETTGMSMKVVTASEMETESLSDFEVIFLLNVDEASTDRIKSLEQWVRDGGALILMPGNRVRATAFNESFYRDGAGLSPMSLVSIAGDPTMSKWVNFEIDPQIHPALRTVVNSDASSLSGEVVFSWWTSILKPELVGKTVSVPLRLNDQENSPAMVDRNFGAGNVVVFTVSGDGDWTNWPSSPTYPLVIVDLIDYLVGSNGEESSIDVGGSISFPVDISAYENRVSLRDPLNEKIETVAKPVGDSEAAKQSELYRVSFDNIDRRGFYDLELTRHTGEKESVLFVSEFDARESQLKRLPKSATEGDFFGEKVTLVSGAELAEQEVDGGETEIWMQILLLLFAVLALEQFLGFFWGKRR